MKFPTFLTSLRDPKRWKRWAIEILILAAIVGGITAWQNSGLVDGVAPPLAGIRTDGSHVELGTGGTAKLVVFWATWCGICKAEAGNIESVAADWPVISIAMRSGPLDVIAKYLAERQLKVPSIADDDRELATVWDIHGVPAHFIIDPAGNIRFRIVGYATTWGLRARLWWANHFPL